VPCRPPRGSVARQRRNYIQCHVARRKAAIEKRREGIRKNILI
jgi:hypothetical protein